MTQLLLIDFKEKKLISKRDLDTDLPHPDQTCIEKFTYFSKLIDEGMTAVKVAAKHEDVDLPSKEKNQLVATVNWSKKFRIEDFVFDEDGVRGTLSFGGKLHKARLPWRAVWGISLADGSKSKEWREDFPTDIHIPSGE